MPTLGKHASLQAQGWAEASADVLAMFQQPLPLPVADSLNDGSGGASRARSRSQQLPPLPLPATAGFSFAGLPPLPEPAAFTPAATAAAAAVLGALQPSVGLFSVVSALQPTALEPATAAALLLRPMAAAATFAAAATLAEQQQQEMEESMADAVSFPAAAAPGGGEGQAPSIGLVGHATPIAASALTSHLSDMPGVVDSEMHGERRMSHAFKTTTACPAQSSRSPLSNPHPPACFCIHAVPEHASQGPPALCRHRHFARTPHGNGQAGGAVQPGNRGCRRHPYWLRGGCAGPAAAARQVCAARRPKPAVPAWCVSGGDVWAGKLQACSNRPPTQPNLAAPALLAAVCAVVPTPTTASCPRALPTRTPASATTSAPPLRSGEDAFLTDLWPTRAAPSCLPWLCIAPHNIAAHPYSDSS